MKQLIILILTISLMGCTENEMEDREPNYTLSLANSTPSLSANLNSQSINWRYGFQEYQMIIGYCNANGVSGTKEPLRILNFELSSDDTSNKFSFTLPKMDTSDPNEVKSVLSKGQKQLGHSDNQFQFYIRKDGIYYFNSASNQKIEILKTEEIIKEDNQKRMVVWVKIENLELQNETGEKLHLKNGLMVAELYGHIMEN
ncbi:hypothetical protein [Aquiflexum gelatinilyticum]|uniref:Lipoprotein n=1 Tax=Aquiflexum gelatinilyticum TaxID=2961943 RepID=A0A9X2SZW8_9BACT|nr:hypothetical protein [Aquiflexum gelatinilyticum]MCR9014316.1 hypothetical protein [Aquiflexum gelatinilyticum]